MNIRTVIEEMWNDTRAVSPVVATLVLVMVAITGAAGVALMQGQFASEVAEDTNTEELSTASATELVIAGSTTVQPVSELLAEAYMDAHAGTRITVQGGGSGAGVSSVGLDIVDIGAASRHVKDKELEKFSDLDTYQIGGSAVVVIAHAGTAAFDADIIDLVDAYENDSYANTLANITSAVYRADVSGTQDTFTDWLKVDINESAHTGVLGNALVVAKVADTPNSIGFVDYGFAAAGVDDGDVVILGIIDGTDLYTSADVDADHIEAELKADDGSKYANGLTRPLNYITNGYPSVMEQGFIDFARSPAAAQYFDDCGYFAITEFA